MGAPKRMSDVDVDAHITPHPLADKGPIPESEWLPMIPFDYDWMDGPAPRYEGQPGSTKAQIRSDIIASRKRAGLEPLSKQEIDDLLALDLL